MNGIKKTEVIGIRIESGKKDFLIKAYGKDLPDLLRKYMDQLIINAVTNNKIKTKHV